MNILRDYSDITPQTYSQTTVSQFSFISLRQFHNSFLQESCWDSVVWEIFGTPQKYLHIQKLDKSIKNWQIHKYRSILDRSSFFLFYFDFYSIFRQYVPSFFLLLFILDFVYRFGNSIKMYKRLYLRKSMAFNLYFYPTSNKTLHGPNFRGSLDTALLIFFAR